MPELPKGMYDQVMKKIFEKKKFTKEEAYWFKEITKRPRYWGLEIQKNKKMKNKKRYSIQRECPKERETMELRQVTVIFTAVAIICFLLGLYGRFQPYGIV